MRHAKPDKAARRRDIRHPLRRQAASGKRKAKRGKRIDANLVSISP